MPPIRFRYSYPPLAGVDSHVDIRRRYPSPSLTCKGGRDPEKNRLERHRHWVYLKKGPIKRFCRCKPFKNDRFAIFLLLIYPFEATKCVALKPIFLKQWSDWQTTEEMANSHNRFELQNIEQTDQLISRFWYIKHPVQMNCIFSIFTASF